jgi:amino acid adenylation domain-containing protein
MSDNRSELDRRRERLSPEKRELLARRIRRTSATESAGSLIPKRPDPEGAPLSFSQEGLFFLGKLCPELIAYNIPLAYWVSGPLDLEVLGRSLDEVVCRHEILRTRIVESEMGAWQVVGDLEPGLLQVVDLCDVPEDLRRERALELAEEQARQPFDLTLGPLLNVSIYRVSDAEHLFVAAFHHIVSDGWSIGVFMGELAACYSALMEHRRPDWAALPIQFGDYATWQRTRAEEGAFREDMEYWRERLQNETPLPAFLSGHTTGGKAISEGGLATARLPQDVGQRLRAFCSEENTTLFVVLLTVWKALLFRYSGEGDVVVGTAVAGRRRPELEALIGYFVNTIVLRTDISDDLPFHEAVRRVHKATLEAQDHQDLPFETLVKEVRPNRSADQVPLIRTMFVVQNTPSVDLPLEGIEVSKVDVHTGTAKFPLTLLVTEDDEATVLALEYASDVFDADGAERMLDHFKRLMEDALEHPEMPVGCLALLSPEEEHRLAREWNDTKREYPSTSTITALFEAQSGQTPDAPAVRYDEQSLTYGELDALSNQLARCLVARGVTPGSIVAVCMHRTSGLIAAILGVLKAGCAYLPLDPDNPRKRIAHILEDGQAALLVTERALGLGADGGRPPVFLFDEATAEIAEQASGSLGICVTSEVPAYVIYTSGSTGGPKGVCVPHRAVLRLVMNTDYVEISPSWRIAQISNMAFDAATFELWGALLHGACLVGIPKGVALSPTDLKQRLVEERIDALFMTSSLFDRVAAREPDAFRTVDTLMVGGEAVSPKSFARVLREGPPKRLLNAYGPTEVTTFAICHEVWDVPEEAVSIPIGKPIANTTAHLLDGHMRLLPLGVPGELFLGGDGVALGYLGDVELTAKRFLPDPFTENPDAKLYRTGDLVRRLSGGTIEFIGRLDDQVKIRGFRIETGEVEGTMQRCPGVGGAAVVVSEDRAGEKALTAYFVPAEGENPDVGMIRGFLQERLPDYMVPSLFVRLVDLPLNANGKIDRHRLPEPTGDRDEYGGHYEPPATEEEKRLAAIWSELLGVQQVGRQDNFFDLGGHSLMAIRLVSRMSADLGVDATLRDLFEAPTIARLVGRLAVGPEAGRESLCGDAVPTAPRSALYIELLRKGGSTKPPFFCAAGGGSVAGYFGPLAAHMSPEQPFYGLKDPSLDEEYDSCPTVEEIASKYVESIRTVSPHGPYYLGGWSFGGVVAFEMAQQLTREGEDVALLALLDTSLLSEDDAEPVSLAAGLQGLGTRILKRMDVFRLTWPLVCGYLRDGVTMFIKRVTKADSPESVRVTPRECLTWAWHDMHRQAALKRANLANHRFCDRRLMMIQDPFVRHVHRTMREKRAALANYDYECYSGHATLICSSACERVDDPTLGWAKVVQGGVTTHLVEGCHDTFLLEPYVSEVSRVLQECIDASNLEGTRQA